MAYETHETISEVVIKNSLKQYFQHKDTSTSVIVPDAKGKYKQLAENCLYLIDNLEVDNLPTRVLFHNENEDIGTSVEFRFKHNDNIEESIIVREREIQYCAGIKRPRDYAYKRYLFTPSKELGDEDIFFLNKNMEFLRLQESKGIIPNLTYIYGR